MRIVLAVAIVVAPAAALSAQSRVILPRDPGQISKLVPVAATGPAPAGFAIAGTPLVARLRWSPAAGAASYVVWRADGNAYPTARTPTAFQDTVFADTVPDPRVSYQYRLVANYANGTWGDAVLPYISPAPVNPPSLSVQRQTPDRFVLSWPAVPGAVEYRVDGPPLPNTGLLVKGLTTQVSNVPAGPQSWQVVAIYPGGFADYNSPARASAVSRPLPPHPRWLERVNGPGSMETAEAHARQSCVFRPLGFHCPAPIFDWSGDVGPTNGDIFTSWGLEAGRLDEPPAGEVTYTNVTELGRSRSANCFETRLDDDHYTVCYTSAGVSMAIIIKGSRGTSRYLTLGPTSWSNWRMRWQLNSATALDAEGGKWAPHVCASCHGGVYDPKTGLVQGGTLLPIDPGLVQMANRPAQEEGIRRINEMILRSGPTPAVAAYIQGLYGGRVSVPGTTAAANYVPPGWATDANFYLGVVKKDCQMCHLATRPELNFLSAGSFLANKALIFASVCQARSMPHAEVPYRRFWQEDTGPLYVPGLLALRLGYPSCP